MPPLRERKEDIPLLAHHFLRQSAQRYRKQLEGFEPVALQILLDHPWPGNVRELDHAVERAVLMARRRSQFAPAISGCVPRARPQLRLDEMSIEDVERVLDSESSRAFRWQREPCQQSAGPEPQRALSPPAEIQPLSPLLYERRILLLALAAGLGGTVVALILLWSGAYSPKLQWTLTVLIVIAWLSFAFSAQSRVVFPLRTLSNLLAALREGDFSIRARGANRDDVLGEVLREVNALGETLRKQRLGALEATALLRKVMEEIDVAVFAFDGAGCLRLVNRAGERILNQPEEVLLGAHRRRTRAFRLPSRRNPAHRPNRFPGKIRPLGNSSRQFSRSRPAAPASRDHRSQPRAAR